MTSRAGALCDLDSWDIVEAEWDVNTSKRHVVLDKIWIRLCLTTSTLVKKVKIILKPLTLSPERFAQICRSRTSYIRIRKPFSANSTDLQALEGEWGDCYSKWIHSQP